jgi:hypothetical protein
VVGARAEQPAIQRKALVPLEAQVTMPVGVWKEDGLKKQLNFC